MENFKYIAFYILSMKYIFLLLTLLLVLLSGCTTKKDYGNSSQESEELIKNTHQGTCDFFETHRECAQQMFCEWNFELEKCVSS